MTYSLMVSLGTRSYPIYIGCGLLTGRLCSDLVKSRKALVVTSEKIAPLYLESFLSGFEDNRPSTLILPDGESTKTLVGLNPIFDSFFKNKMGRDSMVLALGGGVLGDMVGFAAATYQRGIRWVQIPTTLLAQVDSSVGGKTGVNHICGKNMIGAFHQPDSVIIDIDVIKTLPRRELCAGIAEIIKYGLIGDEQLIKWIQDSSRLLIDKNENALSHVVKTSCAMKADIVSRDERETGLRELLNLGHTFGHAIETYSKHKNWLHGEAIAVGLSIASQISFHLGYLRQEEVNQIISILSSFGLPVKPPKGMQPSHFLDLMALDKKNRQGKTRFILLKKIGDAFVSEDLDQTLLVNCLRTACKS